MTDPGPAPADPPAEGPSPFSREWAAKSPPGPAEPWSPGGSGTQQPEEQQHGWGSSAPLRQPSPPPTYQPGHPSEPYLSGGHTGYGAALVDHPKAVPALLTGIIGLALGLVTGVGALVGIAGVVLGRQARRDIDADPARWTGRGKAGAGVLTGAIGLGALAVWIIFFVLVAVLAN